MHQLDAYSSRDGREKRGKTLRISFGIVWPRQQSPHEAKSTTNAFWILFFSSSHKQNFTITIELITNKRGGGRTYDKVTSFGGLFVEAQLNALSYFENEILVLGIIPLLSFRSPPSSSLF